MADGAGRDRGSGKRETEREQLSEDLVRNILARLAPEELVRAQLVCKEWKRLVRAQRPRQGEPWLLFTRTLPCNKVQMFRSRRPLPQWNIPAGEFPHCWAYDPARDRFFKVELPASMELQDLHSRGAFMKLRHLRFSGTTPGSGMVAFLERGGFLADKGERLADPRDAAEAEKDPSPLAMLWIGNPLLRGSWRRVPCLGPARFTDVVIGRAGSFKVVQHRRTNGPEVGRGQTRESVWRTRVFDSVTGRETDAAPIRTTVPSSYSLLCEDSCIGEGGLVYYLKAGARFEGELRLPVAEVMSYSVEKDEWSVVAPAGPLSHPQGRPWCLPGSLRIFEHQGAVKLSAGIPLLDAGKWGRATNWSHLLSVFGFYSYDAGAQGWVWDEASEVCLPDHFLEAEFRDMKQIKVGGGSGGGHVQLLCCKDGRKLFHPGMELFKYEASSKRWSLQRNASYPMYPRRTHLLWEDAFVAFHPRLDSGSESG